MRSQSPTGSENLGRDARPMRQSKSPDVQMDVEPSQPPPDNTNALAVAIRNAYEVAAQDSRGTQQYGTTDSSRSTGPSLLSLTHRNPAALQYGSSGDSRSTAPSELSLGHAPSVSMQSTRSQYTWTSQIGPWAREADPQAPASDEYLLGTALINHGDAVNDRLRRLAALKEVRRRVEEGKETVRNMKKATAKLRERRQRMEQYFAYFQEMGGVWPNAEDMMNTSIAPYPGLKSKRKAGSRSPLPPSAFDRIVKKRPPSRRPRGRRLEVKKLAYEPLPKRGHDREVKLLTYDRLPLKRDRSSSLGSVDSPPKSVVSSRPSEPPQSGSESETETERAPSEARDRSASPVPRRQERVGHRLEAVKSPRRPSPRAQMRRALEARDLSKVTMRRVHAPTIVGTLPHTDFEFQVPSRSRNGSRDRVDIQTSIKQSQAIKSEPEAVPLTRSGSLQESSGDPLNSGLRDSRKHSRDSTPSDSDVESIRTSKRFRTDSPGSSIAEDQRTPPADKRGTQAHRKVVSSANSYRDIASSRESSVASTVTETEEEEESLEETLVMAMVLVKEDPDELGDLSHAMATSSLRPPPAARARSTTP
ncbi:hypothetical protein OE88DRAFT_1735797 [Heliocybe sulcata]|uniref:Uncharacterized protein n=1 Tax=Heliocybe sulcata TaxID=5364 RepID=A0A5C3N025_9AGAM|nr:hypothetical protein OE88DRAFT_1735797 [Heliocybe sulcata]